MDLFVNLKALALASILNHYDLFNELILRVEIKNEEIINLQPIHLSYIALVTLKFGNLSVYKSFESSILNSKVKTAILLLNELKPKESWEFTSLDSQSQDKINSLIRKFT